MEQASRGKSRRWAGKTLVILTTAMIGLWLVWPRERLLTTVARPVPGANLGKASVWNEYLCWVSSRQLLIITTVQRGEAGSGNSAAQNWQGYADLLDTDMGTHTRLNNLSALLTRATALPMVFADEFKMSSDGKWLLWTSYEHRSELGEPYVAHLDGSGYRAWENERYEESFFLDSSHLAQIQVKPTGPYLVVRDLLDPHKDRTYANLEQAKSTLSPYVNTQPTYAEVLHSEGKPEDGNATVETYRTEDHLEQLLSAEDRSRESLAPIQERKLKLPAGAELIRGEVSPHQKSVFYYLKVARTPPVLAWLHRIIPSFHAKPTLTEELWISRVEGQEMQEIGHVPIPDTNSGTHDYGLDHIDWLPDDRHISFVYRNTLYVVPAVP